MSQSSTPIAENIATVREKIKEAARRCGRTPDEITLIGISKRVPVESIREAHAAGIRHFGESRVQEWESKAAHLDGLDATWHMIGHLQGNKAARAVGLFHTIDTIDTLSLAERLDRAAGEGRRLPVLLEVRLDVQLPHLEWKGLMTIAPLVENPEQARPAFRRLREIRDRLADQLDRKLPELSMGMSHDFEIAIEEGATQVRIGSAIFGTRTV
jgi:hypothetical protein